MAKHELDMKKIQKDNLSQMCHVALEEMNYSSCYFVSFCVAQKKVTGLEWSLYERERETMAG